MTSPSPTPDELQKELDEAQARVDEAQPQVDEAKARVDEAKARVDEAKARVDASEARIFEAKTRAAKRKAQYDSLKAQIAHREVQIAEADAQSAYYWALKAWADAEAAKVRKYALRAQIPDAKGTASKDWSGLGSNANLKLQNERSRRPSTFREYIQLCHEHLELRLRFSEDKRLFIRGTTPAKNKIFPRELRRWPDYLLQQQKILQTIERHFITEETSQKRVFPSAAIVEMLGQECEETVAWEEDFKDRQLFGVNRAVTHIMKEIQKIPEAKEELSLGEFGFENHRNSLSEKNPEVQEYIYYQLQKQNPTDGGEASSMAKSQGDGREPTRAVADQSGIFKDKYGRDSLFAIAVAKPAHKYAWGVIEAGFRPMNLEKEIFDRTVDVPVFDEDKIDNLTRAERAARDNKLQFNAEKICAEIAAEAFDAMIMHRLRFAYIITGQAIVLLHIAEHDPTILYYHTAIPHRDFDNAGGCFQTLVCHILALCVMALPAEQNSHKWRSQAINTLQKRPIDPDAILHQIPMSERLEAPSKGFRGHSGSRYRYSSVRTRQYIRRCQPSDDNNTATMAEASLKRSAPSSDTSRKRAKGPIQVPFCTMACLSSLANGTAADKKCPNVKSHQLTRNHRHRLSSADLKWRIQKQLSRDLDHNCEPLRLQGSTGALFKVTLASHGYTIAAKGTVEVFVPKLRHEARVYRHLRGLQGTACPVSFDSIRLQPTYNLSWKVEICYMLLLAWGGGAVETGRLESWMQNKEIERTLAEINAAGIQQRDPARRNILWNEEVRRIMLIDFERATIKP